MGFNLGFKGLNRCI